MGKSKAKKDRKDGGRSYAAALQRRREDKETKRAAAEETILDTTVAVVTAPVWQYPEIAAEVGESDKHSDALTYSEKLKHLLSYPVHVSINSEPPTAVVPLHLLEQQGLSPEEFIEVVDSFHREGLMEWDSSSRIHRLILPPNLGSRDQQFWAASILGTGNRDT